ncbi:hypothetical protein [Streptomyces sp. NPDC056061]|uniref:DUF7169 domain-containing protein n=1 Tax=Streptomyces sp. NPDC056061 TaxID=3345700 RepID=UPI0035E12F28
MTALATALERELAELRQMISIFDDAVTMPGRIPDVDPDGTGRQATHDPSRPTERTALDQRRVELVDTLKIGTEYVTCALAYVRGTTAAMDRSLAAWEGEEPILSTGENRNDHSDWPAEDA